MKEVKTVSAIELFTKGFKPMGKPDTRHIYVLSDEHILDGDWYFNPFYSEVFQANDILAANHATGNFNELKKVVATTDPKCAEVTKLFVAE
jgi:hypothetical protein